MQHKYYFNSINYTLSNIFGIADCLAYFGNILIILGRDFTLILLVVPKGNCAITVSTYFQYCSL